MIIQIQNQIMLNIKKYLMILINNMINYLIGILIILKRNLNFGEIFFKEKKKNLLKLLKKNLEVNNMIRKVVVH